MQWVGRSVLGLLLTWVSLAGAVGESPGEKDVPLRERERVELPPPAGAGRMSLEQALESRRSVRDFAPDPLSKAQLSQLLWSAQGVTARGGLRTAPSAGALYPLELYVATGEGVHRYEPRGHRLERLATQDVRPALRRAALGQEPVGEAPAVFVIAAVHARTEGKYGRARTPRYVHMEAGHAAQNLLLQATALGLGGVPIGAFDDEGVRGVLGLPRGEDPLYLIPVGKPR